MFNYTVQKLHRLAANQLLQKLSCRKVGLLGAVIYFAGSFSILFVHTLPQLVLTFGIIQGIGFGLLMPTTFTAFNLYFDKRKNVFMSIAHVCLGIETIFLPAIIQYLMYNYGFRGTVAIMSAVSLNIVPAMLSLQPVKWHLKKRKLSYSEIKQDQEKTETEIKPLLEQHKDYDVLIIKDKLLSNVGGLGLSLQKVNNIEKVNNALSFWSTVVKALDLGLFKDPVYLNITCGIALSVASDLSFIAVYPLLLVGNGFTSTEVTLIMTTYFIADLVSRICLCVLTGITNVKNRYLFLVGALFSGIFRIAFTMNNTFWWIISTSAILGFLRCLIQVPLPLVIAEAYNDRFVTAFSLYMVVSGCVALSLGFISATIKDYTKNDVMVVHLLSAAYLLCGIPWIIEIIYVKLFKKTLLTK